MSKPKQRSNQCDEDYKTELARYYANREELTSRKQARNYCWTLNNYTAEELESIALNKFRYLIYGKEVAPTTGTPHLQGYLELSGPMTFMALKEACPGLRRASFFVRKGTREQARDYCLKDGEVTEYGNWNAGGQGKRTDWQQIWTAIEDGSSFHEVATTFPEQAIKYHSGIKACIASVEAEEGKQRLQQEFAAFKPNRWQNELLMDIAKKPNHRKVIWIVDTEGGRGKTYLARHMIANMQACYLTNCKTADAAHAYNGERIVVFDYSRSNEDRINYGVIEQMKNGLIFSPKYDSRTKVHAIPHVVCFSNFQPDRSMLSADRWDIRILNDNSMLPIEDPMALEPIQKDDRGIPDIAQDNILTNYDMLQEAVEELTRAAVVHEQRESNGIDEQIPITPQRFGERELHAELKLHDVANIAVTPAVQDAIHFLCCETCTQLFGNREAGNIDRLSLLKHTLDNIIDSDDEFEDCDDGSNDDYQSSLDI